jgi:hypothetical protein
MVNFNNIKNRFPQTGIKVKNQLILSPKQVMDFGRDKALI